MRRIVVSLAMLLGGLAHTGTLQAGVYELDPPRKYPSDFIVTHVPQPLESVISYILELRAIRDTPVNANQAPQPESLRASYLKQAAELEEKRKDGTLSNADRVNLSACLIRLGRDAKAQEVLAESLRLVPRDSPFHILLQLNLAAVCQEDESLLPRALLEQRQALKNWPAVVPGWNREESDWFRQVEEYALTLMEMRNREAIQRAGRPLREQLPPDPLFPREEPLAKKVQFVGESGEYEAGGIAWKHFDHLPADAEQVVLQLLLWRPSDTRLLWLYGELQNARGKVDWAHSILKVNVREGDLWRNRELDRHIRVLADALPPYRELFTVPDNTRLGENLRKQALLLWWLAPRGALLAPAIGAAANEIGGVVASADPAALPRPAAPQPATNSTPATADAARAGTALPDWRQILVSFLTGVVVALLGVLQWQHWRRQRRSAAGSRPRSSEHLVSQNDIAHSSHYSRPTDG